MENQSSRTLLLVGPGKHFGLEIIRKFVVEGWKVGVISLTQERLNTLDELLQPENISIVSARADIRKSSEVHAAVSEINAQIPGLACVIFNVKDSPQGSCLTIDANEFTNALTANVTGALNVLQATVPFLKQTLGSSIIFTGGGYKDQPEPTRLALSVSKAAIHSLYLAAKETLQSENVRVKTLVIDGVVRNEGPLYPVDVAETFWHMANETQETFAYLPNR